MLEVLKEIIPMILAATFVYSAATIAGMGFKDKESKKVAIISAIIIELISFTIWIPSLNGIFTIIGMKDPVTTIAISISILIIVIVTFVLSKCVIKNK